MSYVFCDEVHLFDSLLIRALNHMLKQ